MNTIKKFSLFALVAVALLGKAWGIGIGGPSVKFALCDPNDANRFTGVSAWQTGTAYANEEAVYAAWNDGSFFTTWQNPNFLKNEKITVSPDGSCSYDYTKYYSNNEDDLHVFVLISLPDGVDHPSGEEIKKYVVAGPYVCKKQTGPITWGDASADPHLHFLSSVVASDRLIFTVDIAAGARTITTVDDLLPFTHSVDAWGGVASAAPATIGYTFNDGSSQTLGSYIDSDPGAVWSPMKNGTYVFTHSPGNQKATFVMQMPPTVTLRSARQRYPWNGKIDVDYTVRYASASYGLELTLAANGQSWTASSANLSGEKTLTDDMTEDVRRVTWDAAADCGTAVVDKNATLTLTLKLIK